MARRDPTTASQIVKVTEIKGTGVAQTQSKLAATAVMTAINQRLVGARIPLYQAKNGGNGTQPISMV